MKKVPTLDDAAQVETPTRTHYELLAAALIKALDDFIAAIPEFESPHEQKLGYVRKKRNVPAEFVADAVAALQASSELQGIKPLNATVIADDSQFVTAFRSVLNHLLSVYTGLKFTIEAKEARLKAYAQQIYAMSKSLAREREGAALGVHVEKMKRSLRRSSRPKKAEPPATAESTGKEVLTKK